MPQFTSLSLIRPGEVAGTPNTGEFNVEHSGTTRQAQAHPNGHGRRMTRHGPLQGNCPTAITYGGSTVRQAEPPALPRPPHQSHLLSHPGDVTEGRHAARSLAPAVAVVTCSRVGASYPVTSFTIPGRHNEQCLRAAAVPGYASARSLAEAFSLKPDKGASRRPLPANEGVRIRTPRNPTLGTLMLSQRLRDGNGRRSAYIRTSVHRVRISGCRPACRQRRRGRESVSPGSLGSRWCERSSRRARAGV